MNWTLVPRISRISRSGHYLADNKGHRDNYNWRRSYQYFDKDSRQKKNKTIQEFSYELSFGENHIDIVCCILSLLRPYVKLR